MNKLKAGSSTYPGKELEAMSFARNYHRWIVAEMTPYLGEHVVEVGAGIGDLSSLLLETDVSSLVAFEPSLDLFQELQRKMSNNQRITLVNDVLNPLRVEKTADSIIYVNVLEHIADDRRELAIASSVLRKEASLLIFVPALSWLYGEEDRKVGHYRRYYKKGLRNLVANAGFEIVKVRYFDILGILPWYLNFVILKNSLNSRAVGSYDRYVVPFTKRLETVFDPPIGKNLLLIARKR